MSWTALVPLKPANERKSRLAEWLTLDERAQLSRDLFAQVTGVLARHAAIGRIILLASECEATWSGEWIEDRGRNLNIELAVARTKLDGNLLVLHPDLPWLTAEDLDALLKAAEVHGTAIAPDRHGRGTNALALNAGTPLDFSFGPDSFRRHRDQLPNSGVVERPGLGFDIDTPDDLHHCGFAAWR